MDAMQVETEPASAGREAVAAGEPVQGNGVTEGLLNLPSKGLFASDSYFTLSRRPQVYLATHARASAPPDQVVTTDQSAEAFIRLLKRRQEVSVGVTGAKKGAAGGASGAVKRPAATLSKAEPAPKKQAIGIAAGLAALSSRTAGPAGTASAAAKSGSAHAGAAAGGSGPNSSAAAGAVPCTSTATPGAPPARAAAAALVQAVQQGAAAQAASRQIFSQEELKAKPVKDLKVRLCNLHLRIILSSCTHGS